jgi:cytochrome c peroxidase
MALASYERTLVSGESDFDRYHYGGDDLALSESAKRGLALFSGPAGCVSCHPIGRDWALFTDDAFHNTGIGARSQTHGEDAPTLRVQAAPGIYLDVPHSIVSEVSEPRPDDLGVYEISGDPADRFRYRTPTLRNVALTAPYMHDGSIATLRQVVAFYRSGGFPNEGLDPRLEPLRIGDQEAADIVAFLESLTGHDVDTLVADAFAAPIGDHRAP